MRKSNLLVFAAILCIAIGVWLYLSTRKKPERMKFCTELFGTDTLEGFSAAYKYNTNIKGIGDKKYEWPNVVGVPLVLKVQFLNGTDFQKKTVVRYAREWELASESLNDGTRKIHFLYVEHNNPTPGDIRIWFEPGGSESAIGTYAKKIKSNKPTMKLGWISESEKEEDRRQVVLHEFGHALGLIHEHLHPETSIPWETDSVYAYYARTQTPPWDKAKVDENIFARYDLSTLNGLTYDPKSIMHYYIPANLTVGQCCPVAWNYKLSPKDILTIRKIYKLTPSNWQDDCCYNNKGVRIPCVK